MMFIGYLAAGFIYWAVAIFVFKGQKCVIRYLKATGEEKHSEDYVIAVLFFMCMLFWPLLIVANLIDLCCMPYVAWNNYQAKKIQIRNDKNKQEADLHSEGEG